jgi:hypothetical protein
MLLTGEEVDRMPMSESEQYYQAMKLRKVDTALVRIPSSSRNIGARPSQIIPKTARELKWFETHKHYGAIPASCLPFFSTATCQGVRMLSLAAKQYE